MKQSYLIKMRLLRSSFARNDNNKISLASLGKIYGTFYLILVVPNEYLFYSVSKQMNEFKLEYKTFA